ncbi:hypothetical protein G4B88_020767 [Cannabis sativa]|uniref:Uncharacterized protein n=1 Tax=Cannabis sativa TaxID=3483 RepID=A0A7J6HNZ3_CANSA|nr:hypothetical protein G4B88_020767 [Cannabis sativa]
MEPSVQEQRLQQLEKAASATMEIAKVSSSIKEKEDVGVDDDDDNKGYCTPKGKRHRIPELLSCPPPPNKKRRLVPPNNNNNNSTSSSCIFKKRSSPMAFFSSPDLEHFFFFAFRNSSSTHQLQMNPRVNHNRIEKSEKMCKRFCMPFRFEKYH